MKPIQIRVAIKKSHNYNSIDVEETCELSENDNPRQVRQDIHEELQKEIWNLIYISAMDDNEQEKNMKEKVIDNNTSFYDKENKKNELEDSKNTYIILGISDNPIKKGTTKNNKSYEIYEVFAKNSNNENKKLKGFDSITSELEIGKKYVIEFDEIFKNSIKKVKKSEK